MRKKSIEVLKYLYRQRTENNMLSSSLIELPNRDGVNDLYNDGYINIEFNREPRTIKSVSISGKGIDWVKNNLEEQTSGVSEATLSGDHIEIKIRPELYAHVTNYLANEDYFHAVEEAYKFVRKRLRQLVNTEKATVAFGYEANATVNYTELFGHEPVDEIEEDFFKGIRFLHLSVQFLRNEKSHSLATTLDRNLALHYIALANLAYDLVSRGDVNKQEN